MRHCPLSRVKLSKRAIINNTHGHHLWVLALIACSFIGSVQAVRAQGTNMQHTENRADQALRGNFRVDPSTLGMSVSIPLASYPGRAGVNVPVTLNFNSKLWSIEYSYTVPGSPFTYTWTKAQYAETSTAGWTTSLDAPYIEYTGRGQYYNSAGDSMCAFCDLENPEDPFYIKRIHVHLPDGSAHEMRKDDNVYPFESGGGDFTGIFQSVDGSRMYFDTATNTLYLTDGSRYIFSSNQQVNLRGKSVQPATTFIDRNGNTLSYDISNWRVTDTLGRTLDNPIPGDTPTVGERLLYLPGVNATTLTYKLRWANLADVLRTPATLRYTGDKKCTIPTTTVSPALFTSADFTRLCADLGGGPDPVSFNPVVMSEVELPNGKKYQFKYNIYGEIEQVLLPTGGYERFQYGEVGSLSAPAPPYHQSNRGVTNHWISVDGTTEGPPWVYEGGGALVKTTAPDNSYTERRFYLGSSTGFQYPFGFEPAITGMGYDERSFAYQNGPMLRRSLTQWAVTGPNGYYAERDPRVTKEVSIILDTGGNALASTSTYQHDADLNVISTNKYDFAAVDQSTAQNQPITAMPTGALVRTEETTFLVNDPAIDAGTKAAYRARNLVSLPTSSRVKNEVGTVKAQSELKYDEAAYAPLTYGVVTGWSDPGTTVRGQTTTTRRWLNTNGSWLETHVQYDQCGSARKSWDARGYVSEVQYSNTYHFAYPTQTTSPDPDGGGVITPLVTTSVYDFNTGRVSSTTDANNQTTSFAYNDSLNRPTLVTRPTGGGSTIYEYGDSPGSFFTKTRTALDAGRYRFLPILRWVRSANPFVLG